MIVKIQARKTSSFRQLLEYMMEGRGTSEAQKRCDFVHKHNLTGKDLDAWVVQFEENEQYRLHQRKNATVLTHEILSWNDNDSAQIDRELLLDITTRYIELRGIQGLFVAIPHTAQGNFHVHICASGLEFRTGKPMRMSKGQFARLKDEIQRYQVKQYPILKHSVVAHGRKTQPVLPHDPLVVIESKKTRLSALLDKSFHHSDSLDDFLSTLDANGATPYYRNGKLTGVTYSNRKFRLRTLGYDSIKLNRFEAQIDRIEALRKTRDKSDGIDRRQGRILDKKGD